MLPFGIQPIHLIVVAVIALLIFGPSRLPEIGRSVGKMLTEFRKGAKEMTDSFKEEVNQPVAPPKETIAPPAVSQPMVQPGPQPASISPSQPVESGKNFCIHCGNANPAGAVFCNKCGNKIAE
jgi:sec-independent protein translocase protein TatA